LFFQEEEEAESGFESSPRRLKPIREVCESTTGEDYENSLVQGPKFGEVKDFEENMMLIERRLSNMERKMSIIIRLLEKKLNDKV